MFSLTTIFLWKHLVLWFRFEVVKFNHTLSVLLLILFTVVCYKSLLIGPIILTLKIFKFEKLITNKAVIIAQACKKQQKKNSYGATIFFS